MNIKQIVIALIDRLAAYAAREAESEDPEETKRQEEAAAKRLAEKVKEQKKSRQNGNYQTPTSPTTSESNAWAATPTSPTVESSASDSLEKSSVPGSPATPSIELKGKEKEGSPVRKFRGVPENVRLFEVFWQQVVELIKVS